MHASTLLGTARLIDAAVPESPEGVVLVLHGGASRGRPMPVSPAQLSVLRMIPIARQIADAGGGRLAVLRLLNSQRGWDRSPTPVEDLDWALAQVAERFGPELPVCLVGHSLGGRAALLSAGRSQVAGVVALAPWVYREDEVSGLDETPIVIIHGDQDRVASIERSRQVAARLRRQTTVSFVTVARGKHAMLSRSRHFDRLAAGCAAWMLLGVSDDQIVQRIAAGATELTV